MNSATSLNDFRTSLPRPSMSYYRIWGQGNITDWPSGLNGSRRCVVFILDPVNEVYDCLIIFGTRQIFIGFPIVSGSEPTYLSWIEVPVS